MSSNSSFDDNKSSTPEKSFNQSTSFSPIGNNTPNKELPGPVRTAYTHACTLNSYLFQWNSLHAKGSKLCQCVKSLKLHEIIGDEYPNELLPISSSLVEITDSMSHLVEGMKTISKQLDSLGKLCSSSEPLINTWSAMKLAEEVKKILKMYEEELKIKILVRENIIHCRDQYLTEIYVGFWKSSIYITDEVLFFLAEMEFKNDIVK